MLLAVILVFAAVGLAGWGLTRQIDNLAQDLPGYRTNIRTKIDDVRIASKGGTVEKLEQTFQGIQTDLGPEAPKGTVSRPVVVTPNPATGFSAFAWLGPVVGPLSTATLVAAMVIFMLLERRDLRDRLIGHGQLATTTKAFDEAGSRVSRQLLMQSLVSLLYGVAVFVGLSVLHVPYPLVWATLGAALRFIPYIGPVLGAGAPIPIALEITGTRMQAVELASLVADGKFSVVCFADLPPSTSSKTRYLVRRLRSALPQLRIAVGRWAPPALADDSPETLMGTGADHVTSLLIESRNFLRGLLDVPRLPVPNTGDHADLPVAELAVNTR